MLRLYYPFPSFSRQVLKLHLLYPDCTELFAEMTSRTAQMRENLIVKARIADAIQAHRFVKVSPRLILEFYGPSEYPSSSGV